MRCNVRILVLKISSQFKNNSKKGGIEMKFYHIPKWAKWIAYDTGDRRWYAFQYRPNSNEGSWFYEGKREEVIPLQYETLAPVKSKWNKVDE